MGWKPEDLEVFSPREFRNALKGHDKVMQEHWAIARQIGYFTLIPHQKKGKNLKPTDLFELEIDEKKTKGKPANGYAVIKRVDGKH